MAFATIAAAAGHRPARPRCASPPARWRARYWARASASAAHWSRSARIRSIAPAGTGMRWSKTRSSARTRRWRRSGRTIWRAVRKAGSSAGAVIEVAADGVPPGLGAPVYGKLDADIAAALMSINAVKGVEIGDGFAAAALSGEENADEMRMADGVVQFESNHAGGILGGISTGQPIVARFAVKPTSSILTPRRTVESAGAGDRDQHQGPARSVRRHPRRAGGRGDAGLRAGGSPAAAPRAEPRRAGGGTAAKELDCHCGDSKYRSNPLEWRAKHSNASPTGIAFSGQARGPLRSGQETRSPPPLVGPLWEGAGARGSIATPPPPPARA